MPRVATPEPAAADETSLAGDVAAALGADTRDDHVPAEAVRVVLGSIAERFHDVALVATREAERRAELAALAPQLVNVEALLSDVHDVAGLLAIAAQLVDT